MVLAGRLLSVLKQNHEWQSIVRPDPATGSADDQDGAVKKSCPERMVGTVFAN
jgi:hypothetical protein